MKIITAALLTSIAPLLMAPYHTINDRQRDFAAEQQRQIAIKRLLDEQQRKDRAKKSGAQQKDKAP